MEKLGASPGSGRNKVAYGSGYYAIKNRVNALGLISHFDSNKRRKQEKHLLDIGQHQTRSGLRKRVLRENLLPYTCEECGNDGQWRGRHLSLQLDHKNGIATEHTLENVRFLCPNCHSQTDTWTGRNVKR
jgi:predicted RNA-binding Zn-ribbon protein involved in translation (DUF1610 family)